MNTRMADLSIRDHTMPSLPTSNSNSRPPMATHLPTNPAFSMTHSDSQKPITQVDRGMDSSRPSNLNPSNNNPYLGHSHFNPYFSQPHSNPSFGHPQSFGHPHYNPSFGHPQSNPSFGHPQSNPPFGHPHSNPSFGHPHSNPSFGHPHSNPPFDPHMKQPATANFPSQSTSVHQDDIRGNNSSYRSPPPETSSGSNPPRSSNRGPTVRYFDGDLTKYDTSTHRTNISSFNTEHNVVKDSFNDNSVQVDYYSSRKRVPRRE